MENNNELLQRIHKLERSSRMAIPFGIIGVLGILAALYFSARALQDARAELAVAEQTLAQIQGDIDLAQSKLDALNKTLADLSERGSPLGNADIGTALSQLATIDSSLAVATAKVSQSTYRATGSRYGAMSVDIFYCADAGPKNRALAQDIMALNEGKVAGRWRVRELSAATNATQGYRLTVDTVRFNADEREVAQALQEDAQKITGSEIRLQQIKYPTPGYISLFLCGQK
ncbi:hypothetical protein ACSV5M_14240 [Cellvibrio sp. ARAG 10.3]|uniref:hypothetical protein n=1 Tax=Cellvibrio sp. ARAG 10.3 TaxID=3451358 RepID=UPI003F4543E4